MAKTKIDIKDINQYVGREVGVSDWWKITQSRVTKFAEATGDFQWIHVDEERARTELPTAQTLVHNFLLLSLIPQLFDQTVEITGLSFGQNKGVDKACFLQSLPTGSEVRLHLRLDKLEYIDQRGATATFQGVMAAKDMEKPVMTVEIILLLVPA